jgi:hypothetical protein
MNIMEASWPFYLSANHEYLYGYMKGKGLGISDEFFHLYCMGGEL